MIGSRRKVSIIFDHLCREGIPEEKLRCVHAPIGLDLGEGNWRKSPSPSIAGC